MKKRLDQDRKNELEPKRLLFAKNCLEHLGYKIHFESSSELRFNHKGEEVKLFPFTGWHTGKSIKDGRGIENLLKQLIR